MSGRKRRSARVSLPFSRRAERELRPFFACGSRKDIGNPGFIRRGGRRLRQETTSTATTSTAAGTAGTGGTEATATRPPPTAASGSTTTTGTIRRLRLRTVRRRVTGLRLRRTSTDRAVVRLRLCGPRTLRAEGLPEDRARGLRSLHTVRARTSHRDAGPSPIHGLPTVSIQVPVFGLTNVRWRTIILAMEG